MLVLRRKIGESITIGNDIVVTVLDVEGDRVKVGIDAPIDITIVRSELLDGDSTQTDGQKERASLL